MAVFDIETAQNVEVSKKLPSIPILKASSRSPSRLRTMPTAPPLGKPLPALIRDARRALDPSITGAKEVFDAAAEGNPVALELIDRYTSMLCAGMSTFITIFRPEVIILGGGVANAEEALFSRIREKLPALTFGAGQIGVPPVVPAVLGSDAGLIGAAFL